MARPLCLDADVRTAYGRRLPTGTQLVVAGCISGRRSQLWAHVLDRLVNMETKQCVQLVQAQEGDPRLDNGDERREPEEGNLVLEMADCIDADTQRWEMSALPEHSDSRFGILPPAL